MMIMSEEVYELVEGFLKDVIKFIEDNIIKFEVKVTEGPMLIEARKLLADGLRNIAKLVEDPSQEITWVNIKKKSND